MEVKVKRLSPDEIEKMGIKSWPIWEKEESSFDWYYDEKEVCYFLEGKVVVELPNGEKVKIEKGDFVEFPSGLSCRWDIKKKVKKHYRIG